MGGLWIASGRQGVARLVAHTDRRCVRCAKLQRCLQLNAPVGIIIFSAHHPEAWSTKPSDTTCLIHCLYLPLTHCASHRHNHSLLAAYLLFLFWFWSPSYPSRCYHALIKTFLRLTESAEASLPLSLSLFPFPPLSTPSSSQPLKLASVCSRLSTE